MHSTTLQLALLTNRTIVNQDQLVGAMMSHDVHFCVVSPLLEDSNAQRRYLDSPRRAIDFTSSMAFTDLRELLNPFAMSLTSFVIYDCSKDFTAEMNVNADKEENRISLDYKTHAAHQNIDVGGGSLSHADVYAHLEYIILVKRSKRFKSLKKATKMASNMQEQLLRKHPTRRYSMSVCNIEDLQYLATDAIFAIPPTTQTAIRVRRLLDVSSLTNRITLTASRASQIDTTAVLRGSSTIYNPVFCQVPSDHRGFLAEHTIFPSSGSLH